MCKSVRRGCWSLVLLAGLVGRALADPPTYATDSTSLGDATCTVRIDLTTPYAPGPSNGPYRLSGTDCNFAVTWTGSTHDGATLTVTEVSLSIGGEALTLPSGFTKGNVRFASTHFADSESSLNITWKAKFHYVDPVHSFTGTSGWVTAEFPFDPYNKGISFATQIDQQGTEAYPDLLEDCLAESATVAKSAFTTSNHHMAPVSGSVTDVDETTINTWVSAGTALFGMTHGSTAGFNDSFTVHSNPAVSGYIRLIEDVGSLNSGRTANNYPKYNYAIMYSCSTITASTDPLSNFNPGTRAACYVGCRNKLNPLLDMGNSNSVCFPNQIDDWLTRHVESLFENWLSDDWISNAVAVANAEAPPRGEVYYAFGVWLLPLVLMEARGDERSTIHWVYLTQSEWEDADTAEQDWTNWYFVWPTS